MGSLPTGRRSIDTAGGICSSNTILAWTDTIAFELPMSTRCAGQGNPIPFPDDSKRCIWRLSRIGGVGGWRSRRHASSSVVSQELCNFWNNGM